jgi:hypothetical protein
MKNKNPVAAVANERSKVLLPMFSGKEASGKEGARY